MSRENRRENRKSGKERSPEQIEQDEFIDELAEEDFNSDMDEGEASGEDETAPVLEEKREVEEEVAASASSEPNVKKTEEEGEKKPQAEVTSLGDEEEEEKVGDEAEKTKSSEAPEEKKPEEAATKPEPTAEELAEIERKKTEEAKPAEATTEKVEEKPEQKPLSDEEAGKLYTDWREQTEELLATHHYALSQEQIDEYEENPAALIPKLMSRVYMDSISAAFNQVTNYLPRMVGMVIDQRDSMNKAEKAFFDKWPDLLNDRDTVLRLGMAYRQANPEASMDDFINEVGAQTMVALRKTPANTNGNGTQAQPSAKPASSGAFKPAVETPAAPPARKKETNVFEQLAEDFAAFDEEELDTN